MDFSFYFRVYALQLAQILSMILLAFVTPLIIGIEEYGKFSGSFAVPGFFIGMLETYSMILFINGIVTKKAISVYFLLILVSLILVFCINTLLLNRQLVFYSTLIVVPFCIRGMLIAFAYSTSNSMRHIIASEILYSITYLLMLGFAYVFEMRSFRLPILMIVTSSIISSIYLKSTIPIKFSKQSLEIKQKSFEFKFLFARLYEDFFITVSPLLIIRAFGPRSAGEFRIIISLFKGISKLFPYKYELIIYDFKNQKLNLKRLIIHSFFFIFIGLFIFILYHFNDSIFIIKSFKIINPLYILSLGFVIALLVIYPLAYTLNSYISFYTLALFLLQIYVLFNFNSLTHQVYFLFVNVSLFIFALKIIKNKINITQLSNS